MYRQVDAWRRPPAGLRRDAYAADMAAEHGDPVEIEAGGRPVRITSPNKPYFPKLGITKLDLVHYYLAVGEPLMRWIHDRPVLLERYPEGVGGNSFFQKRIPKSAPDWLRTTTVQTINGTPSRALVIADLGHVIWAVNQGVLGLHVWQYRADRPQWSDELRIDLDPSPGQTFEDVREAALLVRVHLAERGLRSYVKTTGSKGIHVYVRVVDGHDSFAVRGASVVIARELAREHPRLFTDEWWKELRDGKVFVDFNQNAPHKNVFGAWGVRPRVGAQVSTPIGWDELPTIDPDALTVLTVPDRVAELGDPWLDMDDHPQDIGPLVEQFAADLADGIPDAPWPPVYPKMPNEAPRVQPSRARSTTD
jgi:DNA ligase D